MEGISAINNASYMVQPIKPVSRKDGSQGLIANVKEDSSPFGDIEDSFQKRFESSLQEYDKFGKTKNSEKNITSGKLSKISKSDNAAESQNSDEVKKNDDKKESSPTSTALTEEEQKQVEKLKKIDREVRAHEQAHKAAGGGLVRGGPNYQYQRGPDSKQYAVAGEVSIDMSPVTNNPQKTIQKMQQVKRAALAPVDPSPQDRSVAASAQQIEAQARREIAEASLENVKQSTKEFTARNENVSENLNTSNNLTKKIQSSLIEKYKENEINNDRNSSKINVTVGAATLKK